jgi:regulator of protease activity HflC (stomatin/prohibitin superfamily)
VAPWPYRKLSVHGARRAALATIVALVGLTAVLVSGAKFQRQDAAHVGVVRNGGMLDNRAIRQILLPGQKVSWTGMYSQGAREYPAARIVLVYTVTNDASRGGRRGTDIVTVPTRDGVQVGLQATVFFRFIGERNHALLRRFDQTIGQRRFPAVDGGPPIYPWEGDEGFASMLDATFRPILDNNFRQEVGDFSCAELVASCSLVRHDPAADSSKANANIAAVQQRLNTSLTEDLTTALGGEYFWGVRVRIAHVTLPENVQAAVDDVHAEYVAVNGAKAQVTRAKYEAQRNALRAKAYNDSPALARIDAVRAAPKGATIVLSSGDDKSPGINVGGG